MWLVRLALSRPYTFIVMALLLLILGVLSIIKMPVDIFPPIKTPVVSVIWNYNGLSPEEMSGRITTIFERSITSTVYNIEHIESHSLIGMSIVKIYFYPTVEISTAISQVVSNAQSILRWMPAGTLPPSVLSYDASTVPIMKLILSSKSLREAKLFDLANNFIRNYLANIQGAAIPAPCGGKVRQVVSDLKVKAMQDFGISPQNVVDALNAQALILPAGTQKIGPYEFFVKLNNSPVTVDEFNQLPLYPSTNQELYIRDVAHIRDGSVPQINAVRLNDEPAVMMNILKIGGTSTIEIIERIKKMLPLIQDNMPKGLNLKIFGDQSLFVKSSIKNVIHEGIVASLLTGLLIFMFTGNLRNTLIITISIPLSVLSAIIILKCLNEGINIMTLGGMALAIGILVDDATVEIENINRQLSLKKPMLQAILDGASQIAVPAFVSTLCICIVFLPMFFLEGITRYLFAPFAEAVIFSVFASYVLSRTLVPTLVRYLLVEESAEHQSYIHQQFEKGFINLRNQYEKLLGSTLKNSKAFIVYFLITASLCLLLFPFLGSNFFPNVDAGQIKLHIRAKSGTRLEETARLAAKVRHLVRDVIPANEIDSIITNVGLPISGINLSYDNSGTDGPQDADLFIDLKPNHHPIKNYIEKLRSVLNQHYPEVGFYFLSADIVNQILNFGLPSIINIQINGYKYAENRDYAKQFLDKLKRIPGIVDARIRQLTDYPEIYVDVDRSRARVLGLSEADIVNDVFISLSGSLQTTPNFWLNTETGVSYPIVVQTPQYELNSFQALKNIPLKKGGLSSSKQILGAVSSFSFKQVATVISHYNVQPVINIYASIQNRDAASVARDIQRLIKTTNQHLPKGSEIQLKGQVEVQHKSFNNLLWGLVFSILLVYLVMVVNLQSWLDPLIIISALPAAFSGICLGLFITNTTLSVPAIIGTFMTIGIGISNSILLVNFAKQNFNESHDPLYAIMNAAKTRLRPIIMTALAMIFGMLPIAIGFGSGAEQNAPIGRAVIGGLIFATGSTLFFVPNFFYFIYSRKKLK